MSTAKLLRNSRLLTYAGWGYTAYGRNSCVAGFVNDYLVNGTLPPRATVCPANPNPFLLQTTRQRATLPQVGLPTPWRLSS